MLVVYFIWDSAGAIKIGISDDAPSRLAQLQSGNANPLFLLGTIPGNEQTEASLHVKFASLRITGEWFRATPPLLWHVRKLISRTLQSSSENGSKRGMRACSWLEEQFLSRRIWQSEELMAKAVRDGISRNALYSAATAVLPIRKRQVISPTGQRTWQWEALENWPQGA